MKKGFTLAEVLITLGIIGVVAAMTMPVLINNYQKKVFTTQLKKGVNVVENSVRRFMQSENIETLSENEWTLYSSTIPKYLNARTAPESNILYKDIGAYGAPTYVLNDGTTIISANGSFIIDVNGDKKPNLPGRDRFMFQFKNTGFVDYSVVSQMTLEELNNNVLGDFGITWNKMPACNELGNELINSAVNKLCGDDTECIEFSKKEFTENSIIKVEMDGLGMMACFGQIVSNNWEMKY